MRNPASLFSGSAPETPGFTAVAPESLYFRAACAAPAIPAPESALGSRPRVALSSAQVLTEWTTITPPCNDFSANGITPLTSCLTPGVHFSAACDNLVSAHVVLVDGKEVEARRDSNPDLFWAIRGGGGNSGVVTGLESLCDNWDEVFRSKRGGLIKGLRKRITGRGRLLWKSAERLRCGFSTGRRVSVEEPAEIEGQGQKTKFDPDLG